MANYIHIDAYIFPPNLAEVTSPMRLLLKKDTEFIRDGPACNIFNFAVLGFLQGFCIYLSYIEVFNNMKLIHCTVLSSINQKFPVKLGCDSS
jgi:hypothetical protein